MINQSQFESWLDNYGKAWQQGAPQLIAALFSQQARYFETPFDEPLEGLVAIKEYWQQGAEQAQQDVHFNFSHPAVVDNRGYSRWRATFTRVPSGAQVEIEGFLEAEFDAQGRCCEFREWWHRNETTAPDIDC